MEMSEVNVPKFRFREFEGEWVEKEYGEIYSFFTTNSFSRDKLNYENGLVKNIHYGDIHTKFSTIFDIRKEDVPFINSDVDLSKIKEESYCQEGDLVIADASEDYADIGKTIELKELDNTKLLAGLHTFLARPDKEQVVVGYMGYLLQSWKIRKQVMTMAQGTKVLSLSTKRLAKVKLNLPQKPEQQKIANFLTSIDQKIEQLTKKEKLLVAYKKGVMQKIFSQEIRFRDENGEVYGDWVERKLGDLSTIIMGQSPDSKSYNSVQDGMYLIQGNADIKNRKSNPRVWTNKPTKLCQENDLILTVRAPVGAIAKSLHNACIGRGVCAIRNNEFSDIEYLYQYLLSFEPRWISLEQGSTFTAVNANDIKSLKIPTPPKAEQTKIANFLSSIDKKIEQVNRQIEESKGFKKGLLQGMFV